MAAKEKQPDNEADTESDKDAKAPKVKKPSGPLTLIVVGALALFIALVGAQVAAPLVTQMIANHGKPAEPGAEGEEQVALAEPPAEEAAPAAPEKPLEPAIYTPLDPPFVVSFNDEAGDTRFIQLTLQAMARNEKTIDAIKTHAPAIRNAFLFLMAGYKVEELSTLAGKEKLRGAMLKAANEIMEKNIGEAGIEELYFTSLVIQ